MFEQQGLKVVSGVERILPNPTALELFRYGEHFIFDMGALTNVSGTIASISRPVPEKPESLFGVRASVSNKREHGTKLEDVSFRLTDDGTTAVLALDRSDLLRYNLERDPYIEMFFSIMDDIVTSRREVQTAFVLPS